MSKNPLSPNPSGALTLERLTKVCARTGLSRSEIYRRIAAGEFPKPVKIGRRASAWDSREVHAIILAAIKASKAAA